MSTDISKLEQLAQQSFYKAPTVVVIAGNTNRRLHTLAIVASTLAVNGYSVDCFSLSLDHDELAALKKYEGLSVESYSKAVFKERYKAHEAPSHTKSFIVIEMDIDLLKTFSFAEHKVRTLLCTDVFMTTKDAVDELVDTLTFAVKKASTFNTIIANDDVDKADTEGMYYLPLDIVPVRKHRSYGTTSISSYVCTPHDHDLTVRTGKAEKTYHIPFFSKFSRIKKEGIMAALALMGVEHVDPVTFTPQGFPLIEREINDRVEYYWMGEDTTEEEMHAVLDVTTNLCVGVSVYLSFENVIEHSIEKLQSVLVVAENTAEATLFTEYFVKKEKDSFYSLVFASEKEELAYLIPPLFEDQKVVYMFGQIDSFNKIT